MRRISLVLPVFLLACWPALPLRADPGVFRGPYLNNVTDDAVTVVWESPTPTTGVVHYGVASADEQAVASDVPAVHHEVRLTDLDSLAPAGSRFVYQLEVDGARHSGSFRTAVAGRAPFSFIAYGDNRSSAEQHEAVVDAILAEPADVRFLVSTGDMVSSGELESDWDAFFQIEAPVLRDLPIYLAIGNHEVHSDRWDIGRRIFQHPTDVPPASDDEAFYHFVYGNAQFIVINTEVDTLFPGLLGTLAGEQERWLQRVLRQRPAGVDHRFLFIHAGPYSSKEGRNGNFWLRQWLDDLADADVDLIISGHDHYAERGFAQNGIFYVIHGGGGAPLYETLGPRVVSDHTIMYGETRLGYVLVQVDGPRVEVQIKGLTGKVVDSFVYGDVDDPACAVPSDCGGPPAYGCPGGSWECVDVACRYTCDPDLISSLVTCFTDDECEAELGDQCPGHATCEQPGINPLEWHCYCDVAPQCVSDAGCQSRVPPIPGCEGTWACVDEVCEFTPTAVCNPEPEGDPEPDAGPELEGDEPPGDAGEPDAGEPDAGAAPDTDESVDVDAEEDTAPGEPDSEPTASGSAGGDVPEDRSCGCLTSPGGGNAAVDAWWLYLGLAAWTRRRRSSPRRTPAPRVARG